MIHVAQRLVVRGRVQAVGYRDAAIQTAFEAGVAGWVRNNHDGTVEVHVQGPQESVERFIDWCRRGPPLARVTSVETADAAVDTSMRHFERRATT